MTPSGCLNDDAFGPAVQGCRGDFDFTRKFESIFLSIIPASVFVALAAARIGYLAQRRSIVVGAAAFQGVKIGLLVAYGAIQFVRVVLLATAGQADAVHGLSLAAAVMALVAAVPMVALSSLEHARSPRPSALLSLYLSLTLLFDIAQARTSWLAFPHDVEDRFVTASVASKALVLVAEARRKTRWLRWTAEEHSPEETSGIFAFGSFFWLNQLFRYGYSGIISIQHLYSLDQRNGLARHRFGLARAFARALAWPLLLPAAPRVAYIGFTFCQPFFITSLPSNLRQRGEQQRLQQRNEGYGLIGACALIYTGIALSMAFYTYYSQRVMYMARGCLASAIYKKTTEAKLTAADDATAVTLMSTDVERIVRGFAEIHEVWANAIEVALGCWLLQRKLGFAFLAPVIIILVCSAAMSWVGTVAGRSQARWMAKIQTRVGLTANVIAHMKQLKIAGIAEPAERLIHVLRIRELDMGNRFRLIVISATVAFAPQCLSPVFAFALTGSSLDVTTMFESLSYLVLLTTPLAMLFQNLSPILSGFSCLDRIQSFLEAEPRHDFRVGIGLSRGAQHPGSSSGDESKSSVGELATRGGIPLRPGPGASPAANEVVMSVTDGTFGWTEDKPALQDVNATVRAGQLTLVVGPVACGKSTLCKALLGEVPFARGEVRFHHAFSSISFCEQTPFLVNASLKENIFRYAPFDQKRYDEVIEATALDTDIATLQSGHDTNVGSGGIALSGGQKNRVSLARALYHGSQLLILDDVLGGLDNKTESEVFRRVFGPRGLIRKRGATAVLCTHSVRHLPSADHIIALGRDGTVVEQGTFDFLMENQKYIHSLGVRAQDPAESEVAEAPAEKVVDAPRVRQDNAIGEALDDKSRQLSDWKVYKYYLGTIDKLLLLLLVLSGIVFGVGLNFPTVWVSIWANDSLGKSNAFYMGIYALFRVSQLGAILGGALVVLVFMVKGSGARLHKGALATVMHAPLTFFTTTDMGIVTNLFSQDTTIIDSELPLSLLNIAVGIFGAVGMAFVVAVASPYLAISYPFLLAMVWVVQRFYLRTSRQLRLVDLEAKSPLYANFLDTIKGVATIRVFGWVDDDVANNYLLLDTSQRPAYLLAMIQQWLVLTLNIIVAVMATMLAALATQLRTNSGFTGASLVTLMTFGESAATIIRFYTLLETSIGAVSRLKTFSERVKSEDRLGEDLVPGEGWPDCGSIEMHSLSASYESQPEAGRGDEKGRKLVLRDLSLSIRRGESVAICGRTGSGKSSLLLVLLRLLDPVQAEGIRFTIDDVPVLSVDRSTLRKRIVAVPQDCVFLPDSSSVKANVDPFGAASDAECQSALETVQLAVFVEERGGLDGVMSADQLSAGQKQLFSLARAMLRRRAGGGVLLLDEVSSGVDQETEQLMQDVVRRHFAAYTVVSVAHRLDMVVRYADRVVVMDGGSVVETGAPRELLGRPGRFRELWESGGGRG